MSEPPQSPRTRVEPTFHNDDSDGNEVAASTGYEEEERHNDGKPMPGTEVQGSADYIGDMLPEWLSAVRKMVEAEINKKVDILRQAIAATTPQTGVYAFQGRPTYRDASGTISYEHGDPITAGSPATTASSVAGPDTGTPRSSLTDLAGARSSTYALSAVQPTVHQQTQEPSRRQSIVGSQPPTASADTATVGYNIDLIDRQWGELFDAEGCATARLSQVLRGLARYLIDEAALGGVNASGVVLPETLASFYDRFRLRRCRRRNGRVKDGGDDDGSSGESYEVYDATDRRQLSDADDDGEAFQYEDIFRHAVPMSDWDVTSRSAADTSARVAVSAADWAAAERVEDLFFDLGCRYHLVQPRSTIRSRPFVPALTPDGFATWITLNILAFPDREHCRLQAVFLRLPVDAEPVPGDGKNGWLGGQRERLPKCLSRSLFPTRRDRRSRQVLKAAMGDLLEEMQAGDGIARGPPWAQQHQQMPSQVRRFTYPNTTMSTASPRPSPPQPPPVQIVKASTSSRRHTTRHHSRRPSDLYGHSPSVTYGSAPIPTSSSTQQAVASRSALAQHARTSTSSLASISETPADHHPERRRPSRRDSVSTARETASATVLQSYQDLPTVVVSRPTPTGTPGPPSGGSETEGDQRPRRRTRGSHASPSPSRPESVSSLVGARGGYCGSRDSPSIDTHTQGPGYGYDSGASSPTISRTPSTVAVPAATTTTSSVDPAGIDSGSGSAMQIGAAEGLRDLGLNEEDISGPGPTWEEWLRKNPRPGPGSVTSYTGSVGGGSVTGHGSSTMGRAGSVDSGEQNW